MKIGIVLSDLNSSQLSYCMIRNINDRCGQSIDEDYVIFFENLSNHVIRPNFALMNSSEIWNFDGILIATSIDTSFAISKATAAEKKYLYVWDLEWEYTRPPRYAYETLLTGLQNPNLELIARHEDHAKAIKNCCNRDVKGIVEDFNIEQLMEVIQ